MPECLLGLVSSCFFMFRSSHGDEETELMRNEKEKKSNTCADGEELDFKNRLDR